VKTPTTAGICGNLLWVLRNVIPAMERCVYFVPEVVGDNTNNGATARTADQALP